MIGNSDKHCYLATPYSEFEGGLDAAFCAAARLAGHLTSISIKLYSPVVHCHPIAMLGGLNALDRDFWLDNQSLMLPRCDILIVGKLKGWDQSFGIMKVEIPHFVAARKPIYYCDPATLTMTICAADGSELWPQFMTAREIRSAIGLPALAHGKSYSEHGGSSA
jgi:hypothetical protein